MSNFLDSFVEKLASFKERFIFQGGSDFANQIREEICNLQSQIDELKFGKRKLPKKKILDDSMHSAENSLFESWVELNKDLLNIQDDSALDKWPDGSYKNLDVYYAWLGWQHSVSLRNYVKISYDNKTSKDLIELKPEFLPICPKCGNNRQVWKNQISGKLTCHRAFCNTILED